MKFLKRTLVAMLAVIMLLTGCGANEQTSTNESTPTVTAGEVQGPDTTSTPDNTVAPGTDSVTATPTPENATPTPGQTGNTDDDKLSEEVFDDDNLIPAGSSGFESASKLSDTKWSNIGKPTITISTDESSEGKKSLYFVGTSFNSPAINIAPYIKQAGTYKLSFDYFLEGSDEGEIPFYGVIRTDGETSFAKKKNDSNIYAGLDGAEPSGNGYWYTYEVTLNIKPDDVGKGGKWNFCLHMIQEEIEGIYIDNFRLVTANDTVQHVTKTETWITNEITIISDKWYNDPFNDVDVDLVLTNGNVTYTIPGFWDGGKTWRVRFMCPTTGTWTYTTKCTDTSNKGLHNQKSTVTCTKYSGSLELYKRGHVKVVNGTRYFMYDDGTPFFYVGDTHWNLSSEPLSNIKTIVDKRVQQNFSVIQSEPLGASFKFEDGITEADISGLKENDLKFKYIADKGLMHVNASFFYPSSMQTFINNYGGYSSTKMGSAIHGSTYVDMYDLSDSAKKALEKICRYWSARYSAFPVMWSLGQEVDNDFFWNRDNYNGHEKWSYVNNPYKYVAQYIAKYDAYKHPLTAHQESTGNVTASQSSFRNVSEHTFYAAQWSPSLVGASLQAVAKDYWENGQGKPVVNYEGRYCYLWTKNFGARAQGWMAFLSGMCGYGWGGQDTWSYLNTYNEDTATKDGVDTITPEEKQAATWQDSLEYSSSYQVGYMRTFFEKNVGEWYNLIPRFDDTGYLQRQSNAYAVVASNSANTKIVAYFYNFSNTSVGATPNSKNGGTNTGTFGKLTPNAKYNYMWFDPINNKVVTQSTFTADANGKWFAGTKVDTDMVLYIYK